MNEEKKNDEMPAFYREAEKRAAQRGVSVQQMLNEDREALRNAPIQDPEFDDNYENDPQKTPQ